MVETPISYICVNWFGINRYYGAEQGFDGCDDPENREPLWESDYDTESELYVYIATVNAFRKGLEIYDGEFTQLWEENDLYAYSRGDNALIVLTNNGESFNRTINVETLKDGRFCNVFDVENETEFMDCFVKSGYTQSIDIEQGAGKFYVAVGDIPIETTRFYEPTGTTGDSDEGTTDIVITDTDAGTTVDPEADGIDKVYIGLYAVIMTILMTFYQF